MKPTHHPARPRAGSTALAALLLAAAASPPLPAQTPAPQPAWAQAEAEASKAPAATPGPATSPATSPTTGTLPALGESAADGFSPAAERALGDRIMRDIWRDPDFIEDPELDQFLAAQWSRLLAGARKRGEITPDLDTAFAWQPFLVRDRTINAFALPGGYVGVHLGLIALAATRDELASVLAHELSHVTQRHIVRSIGMQKRQSIVGLAAMVLGALAASRNPQAAQAIMTTGQAVAAQGQLNFSRDMEREADRVGFGVLVTAGYTPAGMAAVFERLQAASRLNDDGSFPYLRTHPLTGERIAEARTRAGTEGHQPAWADEAADSEYVLMRARARVLMDTRVAALEAVLKDAAQARSSGASAPGRGDAAATLDRLGSSYAGALAAAWLRDAPRATALLRTAEQQAGALPAPLRAAARPALRRLAAELAVLRGDSRGALQGLDDGADSGRAAELLRVRAALLPDTSPADLQQAASLLQTRVAGQPRDAQAWALLGQVWQRLNQPLRALRAEAEAAALRGDLAGALDRLQAGQRAARRAPQADAVESAVIDARLRTLEQQRREQAAGDGEGR